MKTKRKTALKNKIKSNWKKATSGGEATIYRKNSQWVEIVKMAKGEWRVLIGEGKGHSVGEVLSRKKKIFKTEPASFKFAKDYMKKDDVSRLYLKDPSNKVARDNYAKQLESELPPEFKKQLAELKKMNI